ncbi:MAG: hypothetical protein JW881_12820 [Spirochaetales bacterium]|nr:hypothetical protein [Spirochaetales bacterium]
MIKILGVKTPDIVSIAVFIENNTPILLPFPGNYHYIKGKLSLRLSLHIGLSGSTEKEAIHRHYFDAARPPFCGKVFKQVLVPDNLNCVEGALINEENSNIFTLTDYP